LGVGFGGGMLGVLSIVQKGRFIGLKSRFWCGYLSGLSLSSLSSLVVINIIKISIKIIMKQLKIKNIAHEC
jgi:hypothetical protein